MKNAGRSALVPIWLCQETSKENCPIKSPLATMDVLKFMGVHLDSYHIFGVKVADRFVFDFYDHIDRIMFNSIFYVSGSQFAQLLL